MQEGAGEVPAEVQALKAELVRLRIKLADTEDEDIRKALSERIAQIEAQMPAPEEVEEPEPDPPTPEQLQEAEKLVVQARVEKMRNNSKAATDLLRKATEIAPGSPTLLEALGDDLMERRQFKQAQDVYRKASKLDPKNVGLERKFATAVSIASGAGSLDDQMRANLSDFAASEAHASAGAAIILSALLPGLGQVVIGRKSGYFLMAAWIACGVWVFLQYGDLAKLLTLSGGSSRGTPNLGVLVPLVIMAAIYLGSIATLQGAKKQIGRRKIEHPVPPVDKKFEL